MKLSNMLVLAALLVTGTAHALEPLSDESLAETAGRDGLLAVQNVQFADKIIEQMRDLISSDLTINDQTAMPRDLIRSEMVDGQLQLSWNPAARDFSFSNIRVGTRPGNQSFGSIDVRGADIQLNARLVRN